jgi:phytoene dehydrogenase-like protein
MSPAQLDAVIVGAGPNGLTAAARLAVAGFSVRVVEAAATIGGGARTAELTEPGVLHDVCSGFHPFGASSPAFAALGLWDRVELVVPAVQFAHPLDGGRAGAVWRDIERTAEHLGVDGKRWRRLVEYSTRHWDSLAPEIQSPIVHVPRHPVVLARFGPRALRSATALASRFTTDAAAALIPGCAAHSAVPLEQPIVGGLGLAIAIAAHARGWPVARGGSQSIVDGLAAIVTEHGGVIECGRRIRHWDELPQARVTMFDTSARLMSIIAADRLPDRYRRRLDRIVPGAGAMKIDYALHQPVPWTNEVVRSAGTVHVGGTTLEVAAAERAIADGSLPGSPFALVGQQSIVDDTRAPRGTHTLWVYTHVPQGLPLDAAVTAGIVARVESQIERFAPGFADTVRARHVFGPAEYEAYNPNLHGGDFSGGALSVRQLVARPVLAFDPYRAPGRAGIYLCSASAAPGPGVHGMCGWNAAGSALRHELRE